MRTETSPRVDLLAKPAGDPPQSQVVTAATRHEFRNVVFCVCGDELVVRESLCSVAIRQQGTNCGHRNQKPLRMESLKQGERRKEEEEATTKQKPRRQINSIHRQGRSQGHGISKGREGGKRDGKTGQHRSLSFSLPLLSSLRGICRGSGPWRPRFAGPGTAAPGRRTAPPAVPPYHRLCCGRCRSRRRPAAP